MLPVVDRPAIQYVVEEAVNAGLTNLLMITGRNKRSLEDHFDREPGLERALEMKSDMGRLELIQQEAQHPGSTEAQGHQARADRDPGPCDLRGPDRG